MKTCIICKELKSLDKFYTHKQMKDGHINKCKECSKSQSIKRQTELRKDFNWIEKEKIRSREKYYRLKYKEKYKHTFEVDLNSEKRKEQYNKQIEQMHNAPCKVYFYDGENYIELKP